ncbi:MAG: glycosyltransferase, partial [Acidobacteriota bacterium]
KRVAGQRCPATARKTFVVRNGPDIRWFKPTKPNSALKKGRSYLLGYLGIMAVQDGVEYILKAARYLIREKRFEDFIIYLIGAGDDVRRLKRLAKDYALEREVVFTGRLPDGPTIEILSTADLCLSPDPFNALNDSSTMNKVMEYMALGKPIVSFQLSEARYSAGDAALYVANNDERAFAEGIYELLLDGGRRDQMGRYGKRRLEDKLAWHKQIDNLIEVYRFVGGTPPDRRQKPDGRAPQTPRRTR